MSSDGRDDHPLLTRLLRKAGASPARAPDLAAWRALLRLVGRTYHDADQDGDTLERSNDISSREMQGLYQDLKRRTDRELETQRQRIEESYAVLRATLDAASEGILVVDADGAVIAANRRLGEMMRVPAALLDAKDHQAIVAAALTQFMHPEAARRRIEEIHATNLTYRDEVLLRDGRIVDRYSAPVRLPDGTGVGRVTFFRDITHERAAHEQLQRAWAAAETASTAKSMFLANMSHELRTPLSAVIGLADLLLLETAEPMTPRQRDYVEGIARSGRHLLALVNDVLDLAKIEAGRQDVELEAVDVRTAVEEAMSALVPLARERGVGLAIEVARDVRPARADRVRLRQILFNLISNAVKFTDRGGHVTIAGSDDGDHVEVAVRDTGIGISQDDLPRLFLAFEQLTPTSGNRPPGTGLGLALTRRLVDMLGGVLAVDSTPGVGTTFTVRLPTARPRR